MAEGLNGYWAGGEGHDLVWNDKLYKEGDRVAGVSQELAAKWGDKFVQEDEPAVPAPAAPPPEPTQPAAPKPAPAPDAPKAPVASKPPKRGKVRRNK